MMNTEQGRYMHLRFYVVLTRKQRGWNWVYGTQMGLARNLSKVAHDVLEDIVHAARERRLLLVKS
jgi:hypothetical protein